MARKRQAAYESLRDAFAAVIGQAQAEDAQREALHVWTYKRYAAQAMLDALEKIERKGCTSDVECDTVVLHPDERTRS